MVCGIYKIENLVNGKVYIGQTVNSEKREIKHKTELKNNVHHNLHLQRSYNKFGAESFKFIIIEICEESKLDEREIYWLNFYGGINSDRNYNIGEIKGGRISQEVKDKISLKNKGQKRTEETKRKMRKPKSEEHRAHMGKVRIGTKLDEDTKRKISESKIGGVPWNKGRTCTLEENLKNSESHKGQVMSEETKAKISNSLKGKKPWNTGKHLPEEMKQKIKNSCMGKTLTFEQKEKLSNSLKGRVSPNKGKHFSEDHKNKIKQANLGHKVSEETRKKISDTLKRKAKENGKGE